MYMLAAGNAVWTRHLMGSAACAAGESEAIATAQAAMAVNRARFMFVSLVVVVCVRPGRGARRRADGPESVLRSVPAHPI